MAKARHSRARSPHRLRILRCTQEHHLRSARPLRHHFEHIQRNRPRVQHHPTTWRHHSPPHRLHHRLRIRLTLSQESHLRPKLLSVPRARINPRSPRFPLGLAVRCSNGRLSWLRSVAADRASDASDPAEWLWHAYWRAVRLGRVEQGMREAAEMDVLLHEPSVEC